MNYMSYSDRNIRNLATIIDVVCGLAVLASVIVPTGIVVLMTISTNNINTAKDFWDIIVANKILAGVIAAAIVLNGLVVYMITLIPLALSELMVCIAEIEKNTRKS